MLYRFNEKMLGFGSTYCKRPSASELKFIIGNWEDIFRSIIYVIADEEVSLEAIKDERFGKDVKEFWKDVEEFWKADKVFKTRRNNNTNNKPITKSHPQAYHTSR